MEHSSVRPEGGDIVMPITPTVSTASLTTAVTAFTPTEVCLALDLKLILEPQKAKEFQSLSQREKALMLAKYLEAVNDDREGYSCYFAKGTVTDVS